MEIEVYVGRVVAEAAVVDISECWKIKDDEGMV